MRRAMTAFLTTMVLLMALAAVAAAEQKPIWVDNVRGAQPMEQKPVWVD